MDVPQPITKAQYSRMMKAISSTAVIKAEAVMKDSADTHSHICLDEYPESTAKSDGVIFANVDICIDVPGKEGEMVLKKECLYFQF